MYWYLLNLPNTHMYIVSVWLACVALLFPFIYLSAIACVPECVCVFPSFDIIILYSLLFYIYIFIYSGTVRGVMPSPAQSAVIFFYYYYLHFNSTSVISYVINIIWCVKHAESQINICVQTVERSIQELISNLWQMATEVV